MVACVADKHMSRTILLQPSDEVKLSVVTRRGTCGLQVDTLMSEQFSHPLGDLEYANNSTLNQYEYERTKKEKK